jgi:hypothetical protein
MMSMPMRMLLRGAAALGGLFVMLSLTACQTPLERAWRLSQEAHVAGMIENPDAGRDDLEARRPDGASTGAALDRFRQGEKSAEEKAPPTIINIGS